MTNDLQTLKTWFTTGEVFAYPTEAVYGLGCDPQNKEALNTILEMKSRPVEKGVILIASNFEQIAPYVLFDSLPESSKEKILATWPGPVTWLLPKSPYTPDWISGDSTMVAVRITDHPLVRLMCEHLDHCMVSTSANPAGLEPAKNAEEVRLYFGDGVNIVAGDLGQQATPSKIYHSLTMETIRA